jgi:hypothetical protein
MVWNENRIAKSLVRYADTSRRRARTEKFGQQRCVSLSDLVRTRTDWNGQSYGPAPSNAFPQPWTTPDYPRLPICGVQNDEVASLIQRAEKLANPRSALDATPPRGSRTANEKT